MPRARRLPETPIDLALQGGGSHGAFTWGVLDRLLEDPTLTIDGVSGTSAGALNAAVMATGWADGGRDGARAALRAFWLDVAEQGRCFGGPGPWPTWPAWPMGAPGVDGLGAFNPSLHPLHGWTQGFLRSFSPYQFNPLGLNPLRQVLARHVDEAALRRSPLSLFVTATAVRTGQPRVFHRHELGIDALLASACLPQLFQAVSLDGEPYWDGGYSGNPALWPLIYDTRALDLLLVQISPLVREALPDTPAEIADRINEITFNAGLVAEMRAIAFVQRLVQQGRLDADAYKDLRLHRIVDEDVLGRLAPSSKLVTDRRFLEGLHDRGREVAGQWLARHRADLGRRGTLDPASHFLAPR